MASSPHGFTDTPWQLDGRALACEARGCAFESRAGHGGRSSTAERRIVTPETPVQVQPTTPREVVQQAEHRSHQPELVVQLHPSRPHPCRGRRRGSHVPAGVAHRKSICFVTRRTGFDSRLRLHLAVRFIAASRNVAQSGQRTGVGDRGSQVQILSFRPRHRGVTEQHLWLRTRG